jgi:hypothetical protein
LFYSVIFIEILSCKSAGFTFNNCFPHAQDELSIKLICIFSFLDAPYTFYVEYFVGYIPFSKLFFSIHPSILTVFAALD